MDRREQVVESAGWRNPEKAFHRLIGLVEDAVRNIHRHPDEVARLRHDIPALENEIKTSLEKVDELVLRWMDMRRDECPRGKRRMPGKRTLAQRLRNVSLSQNIPDNAFDAGTGLGDACGQRLHLSSPITGLMPPPRLRLMQRSVVQA